METPIFERLKVVFWLCLVGILVILPLIPTILGVSDELIRSVFLSISTLIISTLLLIDFSFRRRIFPIHFPISILLFFISLIIFLSTLFSLSKTQSLFGYGMEFGTVASFVSLVLFYIASRKFFSHPNFITDFYKILYASFLVLITAVFITTSLHTTNVVFDVFDLTVFSGLTLLISVAIIELSKRNIYVFLLAAISLLGLLFGSDKSVLLPLFIGILIIIFSKLFLIKKTENKIKIPYVAIIILGLVSILFIFNISPIIDSGQHGEIRPSWEATRIIVSNSVIDNPLRSIVGSGPNTFSYIWDLYKPVEINKTPIWNINVDSGVGGIPTLFATIGLLGGVAFLILIAVVFYVGTLGLIRNYLDGKKYYLICSSFALSLYGLLVFLLQNQSIAYITLTFVFLGILSTLVGSKKAYDGVLLYKVFKLIFIILIGFIITASSVFILIRAFNVIPFEREVVVFNNTGDIDRAFNSVTCPGRYINSSVCYRFLAEMHRNNIQTIFSKEVIQITQEEVERLAALMLINAEKAVESNRIYYRNWVVLGNAHTQLSLMGTSDGFEKALESYNRAIQLAPTNPFLHLLKAQLVYYVGQDESGARQIAQESIYLKSDYEPSVTFLENISI